MCVNPKLNNSLPINPLYSTNTTYFEVELLNITATAKVTYRYVVSKTVHSTLFSIIFYKVSKVVKQAVRITKKYITSLAAALYRKITPRILLN